jgi:hypothetical protein
MMKRTIKPAAGESRVSRRDATSAARVVYRDGTTGRFVIVEGDLSGRFRGRSSAVTLAKGRPFSERKGSAAAPSGSSVRASSKKK